jgi:hypothetical protein
MRGDAGRLAKDVLRAAGLDVAIGYGAFLVIALFVGLLGAGGFMSAKLTLADLLSGDAASAALGGGSGKGILLVLLAAASIAVPVLWKHRLAPLAFGVPLFATAVAFWPLYQQHRAQREALAGLGELGIAIGRLADQAGARTGPLDELGVGAWLLFAAVIFLALRGIARALARR